MKRIVYPCVFLICVFALGGCGRGENRFDRAVRGFDRMIENSGQGDDEVIAQCDEILAAYAEIDTSKVDGDKASQMASVVAYAKLWKNELQIGKLPDYSAADMEAAKSELPNVQRSVRYYVDHYAGK